MRFFERLQIPKRQETFREGVPKHKERIEYLLEIGHLNDLITRRIKPSIAYQEKEYEKGHGQGRGGLLNHKREEVRKNKNIRANGRIGSSPYGRKFPKTPFTTKPKKQRIRPTREGQSVLCHTWKSILGA